MVSRRATVCLGLLLIAACGGDTVAPERPRVPAGEALQRIAFGSCAWQMDVQPIWDAILETGPDLFIHLGDSIYPDVNDEGTALIDPWPRADSLDRMQASYAAAADKPGFRRLRAAVPLLAVWDDHDYGINDGAADSPLKKEAQRMFLDFLGEPVDSSRRLTPGIYDAALFGPRGRQVQILLLDTRYFRSTPLRDDRTAEEKKRLNIVGRYAPSDDAQATVLGAEQWRWLEQQLAHPADVRLLVSSYPVIPDELGRMGQLSAGAPQAVRPDRPDRRERGHPAQRGRAFRGDLGDRRRPVPAGRNHLQPAGLSDHRQRAVAQFPPRLAGLRGEQLRHDRDRLGGAAVAADPPGPVRAGRNPGAVSRPRSGITPGQIAPPQEKEP